MSKLLDSAQSIDKGCVLIVEAGHLLSCNDVTICKGMLIYHHYCQKAEKDSKSFFYLFAFAALNLSIQVCEEIIKPEEVLRVFKHLGKHSKEVSEKDLEANMRCLYFEMYRMVFDRPYREAPSKAISDELCCETAHKYVFPYLRQLLSIPDVQKNLISIQTFTLRLLFTFYHCQRCTCYEALEIAFAALKLAFHHYRIDTRQLKILTKEICCSGIEVNVRNAMDDIMMVSDVSTEHLNYSVRE